MQIHSFEVWIASYFLKQLLKLQSVVFQALENPLRFSGEVIWSRSDEPPNTFPVKSILPGYEFSDLRIYILPYHFASKQILCGPFRYNSCLALMRDITPFQPQGVDNGFWKLGDEGVCGPQP